MDRVERRGHYLDRSGATTVLESLTLTLTDDELARLNTVSAALG